MTAHDLIFSIFGRPQRGVAGNMRRITRPQLDLLRQLVTEDKEASAMQPGRGLSFVWMPRGREKYIVTEDLSGDKHTLMRVANVRTSDCGLLF